MSLTREERTASVTRMVGFGIAMSADFRVEVR